MTDLRAWWWHRQGLDGSLKDRPAAEVLAASGWARSVGGSGPYLGLHARSGAGREAIDRDVAECRIHELPSARGCTYVVPAEDFALALKVAQGMSDSEMSTARKLGVTDAEVDKLALAVVALLKKGPLDPAEIKEGVGGAVRNLGEAGKKKGMTTTLPLALGRLQIEGEIRRVPVNGRIDQQRYRYAHWKPNPLKGSKLSADAASTELARRYFDWTAPATLAEFQAFSALGVKAAKAAVEPLGLEPLETGDDRLIPPGLRKEISACRRATKPQYALVGSVDSILLLRRNIKSLMDTEVERRLAAGGSLMDLPSHAILDRGSVVGLWEYDTGKDGIAWMPLGKADDAMREAVERTEKWIRADLGDARSFSLDSPESRKPHIAALRKGTVPK